MIDIDSYVNVISHPTFHKEYVSRSRFSYAAVKSRSSFLRLLPFEMVRLGWSDLGKRAPLNFIVVVTHRVTPTMPPPDVPSCTASAWVFATERLHTLRFDLVYNSLYTYRVRCSTFKICTIVAAQNVSILASLARWDLEKDQLLGVNSRKWDFITRDTQPVTSQHCTWYWQYSVRRYERRKL